MFIDSLGNFFPCSLLNFEIEIIAVPMYLIRHGMKGHQKDKTKDIKSHLDYKVSSLYILHGTSRLPAGSFRCCSIDTFWNILPRKILTGILERQ